MDVPLTCGVTKRLNVVCVLAVVKIMQHWRNIIIIIIYYYYYLLLLLILILLLYFHIGLLQVASTMAEAYKDSQSSITYVNISDVCTQWCDQGYMQGGI
jgi:hypothetical protein